MLFRSEETRKATHGAIARPGPCYIRFAREATPAVSLPDSPFEIGKATVIKYLGKEKPRFIDAFSTVFAADYRGPGDDVALAATGPVVAEAMRAAWILKREFGIEARVLNFSTLKPLDIEAIERTAGEVKAMVTVEEHQKGGFGNLVAAALMAGNQRNGLRFAMMGIEDRFGTSGAPWELMKHFGLTAEHIAQKAAGLLGMPAKPPKPDSP